MIEKTKTLLTAAALFLGGCFGTDAAHLVCASDADCDPGSICGPEGSCVEGCHGNLDCPEGELCSALTHTCFDPLDGGGPDSDADGDSDSDTDGDGDTDSVPEEGCPEPGTVPCDSVDDCAEEPVDCTCLDLLDLGGYCYPDCSDCQQPYQCLQGGCLFVGQVEWEFDLVVIDPDVGGATYLDFDMELNGLEVSFAYGYAMMDDAYGYVWLQAIATEGQDGGYVFRIGIDEDAYGVGGLSLDQMGTSMMLLYYDSWDSYHPQGLAISIWDPGPALTLTHADTEVGGHVVGSLDVRMLEYKYDL